MAPANSNTQMPFDPPTANGVATVPNSSVEKESDTVHMLVLETDDAHPETVDRKGTFGEIFNSLFNEAGRDHDPQLTVTTSMHYVVDDAENGKNGRVPKLWEIPETTRSIIMTGSMYDAHSDEPWVLDLLELLRGVWTERPEIKLSGVCFGHQIIARLLGSRVEATASGKWELSHTEMSLTSVGQKLFRTNDEKLYLHQMHQDQVTTKPSHESSELLSKDQQVHVWASTDHTEIQGLYIRDRIFTSQGHLGFDEQMVHRQIEAREESGGIQDSKHAEEAKETAHLKHDGVVVAGAILRFFHGEDHNID